jgi:hypothetical protein
MTDVGAGEEEQRRGRQDDDEGGAGVGLDQDEPGDEADGQRERHEAEGKAADRLAAARQPGGDIDDDRQLGELGGLEGRQRAKRDPAPGAVGVSTDDENTKRLTTAKSMNIGLIVRRR